MSLGGGGNVDGIQSCGRWGMVSAEMQDAAQQCCHGAGASVAAACVPHNFPFHGVFLCCESKGSKRGRADVCKLCRGGGIGLVAELKCDERKTSY